MHNVSLHLQLRKIIAAEADRQIKDALPEFGPLMELQASSITQATKTHRLNKWINIQVEVKLEGWLLNSPMFYPMSFENCNVIVINCKSHPNQITGKK